MSTEKEFYTVQEASALLLVKPQTIRAWLRDGVIPGHNLNRRRWLIPVVAIERLKLGRSPQAKENDES